MLAKLIQIQKQIETDQVVTAVKPSTPSPRTEVASKSRSRSSNNWTSRDDFATRITRSTVCKSRPILPQLKQHQTGRPKIQETNSPSRELRATANMMLLPSPNRRAKGRRLRRSGGKYTRPQATKKPPPWFPSSLWGSAANPSGN